MDRTSHVRLMAQYNQWMNARLYAAAATLPPGVVAADRKAFFGSILATLNHLVNADIIWLKRFAAHPARYPALAFMAGVPLPVGQNEARAHDLAGLAEWRHRLDEAILAFAAQLRDADLDVVLDCTNRQGVVSHKRFDAVLTHFFNHQTHHRGQVTTLLSQEGVDAGVTDILALAPEAEAP